MRFGVSTKVAVAIVYIAAMFINIIDATVVNVALPTIAHDFGVPLANTATVNIGFLVALAVSIPVAGWLGDRLGAREVFAVAVTLFTAASAACGLASSVEELVLFRIVQGIGGGVMTPVGMAMLYRTFPPAERVRLSRLINIPIAFAPALGPIVGGLLVEKASWRWIFGINVPIGVFAVAFTLLAVPRLARAPRTRLDLPGFLLATAGFAAFMFAVSEGASRGWASVLILLPGLVGVGLLVTLVAVERRVAEPMLRLELFRVRLFRSANLITLASSAGFIGALFAYPLMLQAAFGHTPLEAGLLTFPEAIGVMIGVQIAARIYRRVGPRRLLAAGQFVVAVMMVCLALLLGPHTPPIVNVVLMTALGIGQAHTFMPTQAAAFDTVPHARTGAATALYNATRQVGGAIGVALAATVIASVGIGPTPASAEAPFRWALIACALCALAGSVAALTVHDVDAAPSRGLAPPLETVVTRAAEGGGRPVSQ